MGTDAIVPSPCPESVNFVDNNIVLIKWNQTTTKHYDKIIGYTLVYKGDDGSERKVKAKKNERNITLKEMSKCVNYEFQLRSDSIYSHSNFETIIIEACEGTFTISLELLA